MGPKCNHKCPYKREAEGALTQKAEGGVWWQQRRFEGAVQLALRMREGAGSQGMQL